MTRAKWKYPVGLTRTFANERRKNNVRPQPVWMKKLKIGDVLTTRNGRVHRVVRQITHYKCGNLHGVTFTIKHCSWTHRCETFLNYNDLLARGMAPTGKHVILNSRLDRKIAKHLLDHNLCELDCCSVRGIA